MSCQKKEAVSNSDVVLFKCPLEKDRNPSFPKGCISPLGQGRKGKQRNPVDVSLSLFLLSDSLFMHQFSEKIKVLYNKSNNVYIYILCYLTLSLTSSAYIHSGNFSLISDRYFTNMSFQMYWYKT